MTINIIRASHANEFELQNYYPLSLTHDIRVITSHRPLTPIKLPTIALWSPTDLPQFPFRRQLLNRLIGGEQWLLGLETSLTNKSNGSSHLTIAHTAETYTPYTHQVVRLRRAGKISKLICTCWETIPHANEKFARVRQWKKEAYQYVDLFHTPTVRAKNALIAEGVDEARIVVIPYGVDLARFHPVTRHKPLAASRKPTILTVARLEKEKGIEDLVAVAKALPQYNFLVVGRGSYRPVGDNIEVKSVPYDQIHELYQEADLFFLPSRTTPTWEEQYGMALVEAMASGLPIVTTRSGAIPEVVGRAAMLCKEADAKAMTKAISSLITDSKSRNNLSSLAFDRIQKIYDAKIVATQLATMYI